MGKIEDYKKILDRLVTIKRDMNSICNYAFIDEYNINGEKVQEAIDTMIINFVVDNNELQSLRIPLVRITGVHGVIISTQLKKEGDVK